MDGQIVAIDIGNTSTHVALSNTRHAGWERILRFTPDPRRSADEWFSMLQPHFEQSAQPDSVERVICCSVVPAVTGYFLDAAERLWGRTPTVVTSVWPFAISIGTDHPELTGVDRLVNGNTAWLQLGGPAIVVDLGTATKIDAVNSDGTFLGGAIAPGIDLGMGALASGAAQLAKVTLSHPERTIGANTGDAIRSGVIRGHARMIEGLVRDMDAELGQSPSVILTGGAHPLVADQLELDVILEPTLTLDGLRLLAV